MKPVLIALLLLVLMVILSRRRRGCYRCLGRRPCALCACTNMN